MRDDHGRRVQQRAGTSEDRRVRRPSRLRAALKKMIGARRKRPTGEAAECVVCCVEIKFYGAFGRVLHAIDATPARWRGDAANHHDGFVAKK